MLQPGLPRSLNLSLPFMPVSQAASAHLLLLRLTCVPADQGRQFYRQWIEEGVEARRMEFLDQLADAAKHAWLKVGPLVSALAVNCFSQARHIRLSGMHAASWQHSQVRLRQHVAATCLCCLFTPHL